MHVCSVCAHVIHACILTNFLSEPKHTFPFLSGSVLASPFNLSSDKGLCPPKPVTVAPSKCFLPVKACSPVHLSAVPFKPRLILTRRVTKAHCTMLIWRQSCQQVVMPALASSSRPANPWGVTASGLQRPPCPLLLTHHPVSYQSSCC